ncbi:MAG TPA: hypothetical protein VM940_07325 [Chthoniobacterales bacterium]|jgi:plasmid maintenance system killer protein|nr:hypothetical protein [Chthoniobacterales bacterium]
MALNFRIPKLSDIEVATALSHVREKLHSQIELGLAVQVPIQGQVMVPEKKPEQHKELKYVFDLHSQVATTFQLLAPDGNEALRVSRQTEGITDIATIPDEWFRHRNQEYQKALPQIYVRLLAAARSELKAADVEAGLSGSEDTAWNRYREAQLAVTNSLQQATETLLIRASEKNAELDKDRAKRFEKLESELRDQLQEERDKFRQEQEAKDVEHAERIKSFAEREAAFNTKEAGYVARQKQDEQIQQVKIWLENWNLTKGTSNKRMPVALAYVVGICATGWWAIFSLDHSYDLLKSAADVAQMLWWQWVGITVKVAIPIAAFTSFLIYFIRWSSAWARQHAEEEFRNRALLIDIGRSSWLLEAVRDAQQRDKEIPTDLLRELSRNLFAYSSSPDTDIDPQALSETLLHGLSSVRIKSPDGSEVEATRGTKKSKS